ncbi:MAG TPA: hypothetical protein VK528_08105 [Flavobacterium sp.]|nr:hypothetical protein [Flavobacterium sp.]
MKKLFFFPLLLLVFSCSKEDDNNSNQFVPLLTKVTSVSETDGVSFEFVFSYDAQKRLTKLVRTGDSDATYEYGYNAANQISDIHFEIDNGPQEFTVQYDGAIVKSYTLDGAVTNISYDPATQLYDFNGLDLGIHGVGDIAIAGENSCGYDVSKKGPMYFAGSANGMILAITEGLSLYFASKFPLNSIKDGQGNNLFDLQNTYNESGLILKSSVVGALYSVEITYDYGFL